ncbi:hypothetical protein [Rugamonas rubra]|uniref:Trypsin-like peptidase domain-containing protein n=1 Tax=Rugamonas rubra TaxID=758825 RepID=A0A1I4TJZ1_9BURK|nr:hypothetical protein [Rugamonas rubra]SFM77044.1 hypothetical protein SAMN02982985_05231 [Rugamonas rubra]
MDDLVEFTQRSEALRHHIARYSVTLVICSNGTPIEIGSGTCIERDGIFGIVTAAHVVKGVAYKDIAVIYSHIPSRLNSYITATFINGGDEDDPLDVAFLHVSNAGLTELRLHKSFLPAERFRHDISILANDMFIVYGTPRELLDDQALENNEVKAHPMAYLTVSLEKLPVNFLVANDIAIEYPKDGNIFTADGKLALLPAAEGLSGGGVWIASANKDGLWSPEDARLVGVEISWHPRERWVRGNQIQHVLPLIMN